TVRRQRGVSIPATLPAAPTRPDAAGPQSSSGLRSRGRRPPRLYQVPTTTPATSPVTAPKGTATLNRPVRTRSRSSPEPGSVEARTNSGMATMEKAMATPATATPRPTTRPRSNERSRDTGGAGSAAPGSVDSITMVDHATGEGRGETVVG